MCKITGLRVHTYVELFTTAKWCVCEQIPFQVSLNHKFLKKEKKNMQGASDVNCICKSRSFTEGSECIFFLHVGQQLLCNLCRLWGGCSCRPTAARWQWLPIINMADYVLHSAHNTKAMINKYVKSQRHFNVHSQTSQIELEYDGGKGPGNGPVRRHIGTGFLLVLRSVASTNLPHFSEGKPALSIL